MTTRDRYLPPVTGKRITHALCDYAASNHENTGVVGHFLRLRMMDIADGTSNTLLAGDKRLNRAYLGQRQHDDKLGYTAGWSSDTLRKTNLPPQPDYFASVGNGGKLFGSSHVGGINVAFADGGVRAISYSVSAVTFKRLGNKSDGQVISGNDF